jgi:predicted  nucleic acid-binding Zn-ribbon protein
MSSDDLTHNLNSGEEDNITQPTITAVFRLLRDVQDGQKGLNSRFEALESSVREVKDGQTSLSSRFEALESRLARDFAGVDARFAEMSEEMKSGLLQLSDKLCDRIDRSRLHAEADIEDITRRLRKLESKAS